MAAEKAADGTVSIGEVMIPVSPEAPFRARSAVDGWLLGLAAPDVRADACLLVSEVVTNSVRHSGMPTGAPLHVVAAMDAGTVRVLVADQGLGGVSKRRPMTTEASGSICSTPWPLAGASISSRAWVSGSSWRSGRLARPDGSALAALAARSRRCFGTRRVARPLLVGHLAHDQRSIADLLVHLGELLATLLLRALLRSAHGVTPIAGCGSIDGTARRRAEGRSVDRWSMPAQPA